MSADPNTVKEFLDTLPQDRKKVLRTLRRTIKGNLPGGFKETISYGMLAYVVPLSRYPQGYHVTPDTPLPFISLASQKRHVAVYHMGIYADPKLLKWFTNNYAKVVETRLDMGKSCIRFKRMDAIPYDLIGKLATKMTPDDWIKLYEKRAG